VPETVTCVRCGQTRAGFERPPLGVAGAAGARIAAELCQQCWADWLKQQTMLINHYGLDVMDPQARAFLTQNREAYLFKAGAASDIDTTKQGTISH
jgi:Fe-S cluster biosynthesis and repair protein YggX